MWHGKNMRKEYLEEENYQGDSQQRNYLDSFEQKVQSRILKIRKKLEIVEREIIKGKKNGNNRRRRN